MKTPQRSEIRVAHPPLVDLFCRHSFGIPGPVWKDKDSCYQKVVGAYTVCGRIFVMGMFSIVIFTPNVLNILNVNIQELYTVLRLD